MKVGRYEILDTVGSGAFSRVVRAHDPFIGRIVAVKIFPQEIARGEAREKFFQEARVIGQISHPCVLALHDMGIDETAQARGNGTVPFSKMRSSGWPSTNSITR